MPAVLAGLAGKRQPGNGACTKRRAPPRLPTASPQPYVYTSLYSADKAHYITDRGSGLYRPSAYHLAKAVGVAPYAAANVLVSQPARAQQPSPSHVTVLAASGLASCRAAPHHRAR
jgi:hypothetical protein